MNSYDCLFLSPDGREHHQSFTFAQAALQGHSRVGRLDLTAFAECDIAPGAEMGTVIVPLDAGTDLGAAKAAIRSCRAKGGKLSVLGLADVCARAGTQDMEDVFDTLVSMEWRAAPEIIRRFVDSHGTDMQNRAFKAFLDTSVDGYWIWHVDRDVIEWSNRTREMTRTAADQVPHYMGAFVDMIHPQDRDRVDQAIRNHFEQGAPYKNIEMRLRQGDGSYGYFLANGQALRNEAGQPIILVGSLTDRTLMQKVEQQLEDTQKRFTVLFHQMNDAAVLAEIETGLIVEANQPAERLWGKSVAELVGAHQSSLHPAQLSDEARQAFVDHIAALMQNKRDSIHVPILRADGTEVPAEISSSLIEIDGKTMILGVFRDISERIKAERDLRERDAQIQLSSHLASMGTLAAGVAHEINNPLTYVLGNLELIRSLLDETGVANLEIRQAIDAASTGGRYVREIVSDLKSISRMDASDEACDPVEVIRIASRMAMSDLRHHARLDMDLAEVPQVAMSSARLSQVVLNILSNAARAFGNQPGADNLIRIAARQGAGAVEVTIEDNGRGIAPDDLKRVWEPFFTKSGQSGGTGLGLSICRRILHEVGGALVIESELGVGTVVRISLPVAGKAQVGAAPAKPPDQAPATRPRLMVVDDEELVTTLLARMLRTDFEVTVFNDARAALAALDSGATCDLVLCDIMMPGMDGPAFHAAAGGRVPFLFLTGGAVTSANIAFERQMAAQGRLMHKPFEIAALRGKLHDILCQSAPAGQAQPNTAPEAGEDLLPSPAALDELEGLLGRDALRGQYGKLQAQIDGFLATAATLTPDALAHEAHRVAGASDVMGLPAFGRVLRRCQHAASAGDVEDMQAAIARLGQMAPVFAGFLTRY